MLIETAYRGVSSVSSDPDLHRLSLSQWSLLSRFTGAGSPKAAARARTKIAREPGRRGQAPLKGALDPLEFPAIARREFGFDAVDLVGGFFAAHIHQRAYARDLRLRCDDEGVAALILDCPSEGAIDAPSPLRRERVADRHWRWIDAATILGCRAICVRLSGEGDADEQARLAADGLHTLATRAWCRGVDVLVEGHGGHASNPAWLARVLRLADHPRLGARPDVESFAVGCDGGLAELLPYARGVSARFVDFGESGRETTFDYERMLRVLLGVGWAGPICVSYEGDRLGETDGVLAARALLERHRNELERTSSRLN
jgi:sugar phosphate isomerase/epimerase